MSSVIAPLVVEKYPRPKSDVPNIVCRWREIRVVPCEMIVLSSGAPDRLLPVSAGLTRKYGRDRLTGHL